MKESRPKARRVRRIEPGEEAVAERILAKFKHHDDADPGPFLDHPGSLLFVAGDGAEPLGWAYGYELPRPEGRRAVMLYEIEVVPAARGTGIGRELMEGMLSEARVRGAFEMWTLADVEGGDAHAFYESMGGEPRGQRMYTWDLDQGDR